MADSLAADKTLSSQDVDSEDSSETMETTTHMFTVASKSTTESSRRMESSRSITSMRSVETYESDEVVNRYESEEAVERYESEEAVERYESEEVVERYESEEGVERYENYEASEQHEICQTAQASDAVETVESYQSSQRTESAETTDKNGTLETSECVQMQSSSATVSSSTDKKKRRSTKKSKKSSSSKSSKSSCSIQQYNDMPRLEHRDSKIHVRSVDAGQVQKRFNKVASESDAAASQLCKLCSKQVFQMERIKAERAVWHKNCFACSVAECGKKLTVDTYNSHEGKLYCKPHFKQLFQPKAVPDFDEPAFFKPELIIRESQPAELPDDVVRANESSSSYGVEELSNLDLKSRFSLFERGGKNNDDQPLRDGDSGRAVKRSDSILSRLMRFDADAAQKAGQLDLIDSSDDDADPYDMDMIDHRRSLIRGDDSVSFGSISSIKSRWEDESAKAPLSRREELARQRKEELQVLRARQCHGRQLRLKEAYEQAVHDANDKEGHAADVHYDPDKVRQMKEIFERSRSENDAEDASHLKDDLHGHLDPEKIRQMKQVFEGGGSESARSVHSERQEELSTIARESAKDARNLFKQMEENGFQERSKRESFYGLENKETFKTTSAMLNLFRRLESQQDYHSSSQHSDDEDEEGDDGEGSEGSDQESDGAGDDDDEEAPGRNGYGRRSSQQEELLQIAKERALARNLREKFERWEFNDDDEEQMYERNNFMAMNAEQAEEIQASLNTTRNLRAHFENLQKEAPVQTSRPRFKVNRFV